MARKGQASERTSGDATVKAILDALQKKLPR